MLQSSGEHAKQLHEGARLEEENLDIEENQLHGRILHFTDSVQLSDLSQRTMTRSDACNGVDI